MEGGTGEQLGRERAREFIVVKVEGGEEREEGSAEVKGEGT